MIVTMSQIEGELVAFFGLRQADVQRARRSVWQSGLWPSDAQKHGRRPPPATAKNLAPLLIAIIGGRDLTRVGDVVAELWGLRKVGGGVCPVTGKAEFGRAVVELLDQETPAANLSAVRVCPATLRAELIFDGSDGLVTVLFAKNAARPTRRFEGVLEGDVFRYFGDLCRKGWMGAQVP